MILNPLHPPSLFFFFNDTATTEIYTLSLHDALPIFLAHGLEFRDFGQESGILDIDQVAEDVQFVSVLLRRELCTGDEFNADRKSTRLNSSHGYISYAVFCLKKQNRTGMM